MGKQPSNRFVLDICPKGWGRYCGMRWVEMKIDFIFLTLPNNYILLPPPVL